ncbi:hypothetical protein I7I48_03073 [Histoplasma ohiense]|nr:hypothetical protein I7I48_03073 [Histoplasma ohiense (nom. inval.)]
MAWPLSTSRTSNTQYIITIIQHPASSIWTIARRSRFPLPSSSCSAGGSLRTRPAPTMQVAVPRT